MNFFSRLFNRSSMNNQNDVSYTAPIVPESLFVEKEQPGATEKAGVSSPKNLNKFLGTDMSQDGYENGYKNPSKELLDVMLRRIKSEFRLAIDKDIDKIDTELTRIRTEATGLKGISERLDEQVNIKIDQLLEVRSQLEKEKALSVDEDGIVMRKVYEFEEGYNKGLMQYMRMKDLGGSTGMFNQ